MRKFLPLAAAGASLLVVAGTAMAQMYNEGPPPPTGPSSLAITAPDVAPPLPATAVGQALKTNRGDTVGLIVGSRQDALIVRPGNHFNLSPKAVVVPRDHVYVIDGVVRTRMTGTQVSHLPRYMPPTAANMNHQ